MDECFKVCGLEREEIIRRLEPFFDKGISFGVEENFLDAKITMATLSLKPLEFQIIKTDVYSQFEDNVYSACDVQLKDLVAKLLKLNCRVLAAAESLTGGMLSSELCSVPGISENFYEGIVCYNSRSKYERLGVSKDTLADFGAVSKQTAREMVEGLLKGSVDIGVATTGLAGPAADEGKPVGLVYIAVGSGEFIPVFEQHFTGTREDIRKKTVNMAFFYLVRYLKGNILRL